MRRGFATGTFDPTLSPTFGTPASLTDSDNRFRLVSDEYCGILMRSREELMNIEWTSIVHPNDLADPAAKHAVLLATGEPYVVAGRVLSGDGRWLPMRFCVNRIERRSQAPLVQTSACLVPSTGVEPADEAKEPAAVAEYLQTISGELSKLAERHGLTLLQHLLSMASLEAAQEMQRQFPGVISGLPDLLN